MDLIFNTGPGNTPSPADNDRSPPETTHRRNARAEHTRAQKARRVADLCCDCPDCNLLLATMRLERFLLLGLRPHWRVSRCFCRAGGVVTAHATVHCAPRLLRARLPSRLYLAVAQDALGVPPG